jgi:hypothetical protein
MFIKNLLDKLPKKGADKKYFLQLDEAPEVKPAEAPKVEPVVEAPTPAAKVETPAEPAAPTASDTPAKPAAATKKSKPSAKVAAAPAAPKAEPVAAAKAPVKTVATFADYNQIPSNQFGDRRLPGANMASFLELASQVKTPN